MLIDATIPHDFWQTFVENVYYDLLEDQYVYSIKAENGISTHLTILHPETATMSLYKSFGNREFDHLKRIRFRDLDEVEQAKMLLSYVGSVGDRIGIE